MSANISSCKLPVILLRF